MVSSTTIILIKPIFKTLRQNMTYLYILQLYLFLFVYLYFIYQYDLTQVLMNVTHVHLFVSCEQWSENKTS